MILEGVVVSGLGRGGHFLSIPHYRRLLSEITGFEPYPGTLNVLVGRDRALSAVLRGLRIPEAVVEGRTYGGAWLAPVEIVGNPEIPAWAILPDRSAHPDQLEIISDRNLRRALGLRDGDRILLRVKSI